MTYLAAQLCRKDSKRLAGSLMQHRVPTHISSPGTTRMTLAASPTYPATLSVVQYPHPALRKVAQDVTVFDDALRDFCERMFVCMENAKGIGLAAPQVAVSKRIFITDHARREEGQSDRRVWINPRIEQAVGTTTYEEGCLSFPGMYAKVERCDRFDIVFQDVWGAQQRLSLDVSAGDFLGVVVQHELDHLLGKVFVDYLSEAQLGLIRKRLREMEKDYHKMTGKAGSILRR
jgi:peptide deformylase